MWRRLDVRLEGIQHLPRSGPVLVAARHFHHYYDGCILLSLLPRPVHLLVALDWVPNRTLRAFMERACALARWPVVLRAERLAPGHGPRSAYEAGEVGRYLQQGMRDAVDLLRAGEVVVIFPEGYPTIDPVFTPKSGDDAFLAFRSGAVRLVALAQRDHRTRVAVVPAGFSYRRGRRWRVTIRLGPPLYLEPGAGRSALTRSVEAQVHALSSG